MSKTERLLTIAVALIVCCESVTAVAQSAYTLAPEPDSVHIGTRGQPLSKLIRLRVESTAGSSSISDDRCHEFQLAFTTYLEGNVGPSPTKGQWDKERKGCFVEVAWKLGNYLGRQYLEGRMLEPDNTTAPIRLEAYAHEPARLVVAAILLTDHEKLTREGRERKDRASEEETLFTRFVPMFGSEFSLLQLKKPWHMSIRMLVAGSIDNPGEEFFGGILVQPFFSDPSFEASPIQVGIGVSVGDLRHLQLAFSLSLNSSGLLSGVFGKLMGGS